MATVFQDYMDTFTPVVEYTFDDASGGLVNSGSAGASYDLTEAGNPTYQQAGEIFGADAMADYSIDFDGTGDCFHGNVVSAITALSAGAVVIAFKSDAIQSGDLFTMKPEVGIAEFFKISLSVTNEAITANIEDGTNDRRFTFGDSNWAPMCNEATAVTHILVYQYDAVNKHQFWLDGVLISDDEMTIGLGADTTTGTGDDLWFSGLSGLVETMMIGGRAEYDGAGNFVSAGSEFDGTIEYVGITDTAFTRAQIDEMWQRFVGGLELANSSVTTNARFERRNSMGTTVEGPPQGIDTLTHITVRSVFGNDVAFGTMLERVRQSWVARNGYEGYCPRLITTFNAIDARFNSYRLTRDGLALHYLDSNISSSTDSAVLRTGGKWVEENVGSGTSEAWYGAFEDAHNSTETGVGRNKLLIKSVATPFGENFPMWYWLYTTGAPPGAGAWARNSNWLDVDPSDLAVGASRHTVDFHVDGTFVAMATRSSLGDTPNSGGEGGIHIYALTGSGASMAGTRETLSGYTPTNVSIREVAFFKDGTDDYLIVMGESTGVIGATGELNGIAIFKSDGAGTWTATANLLNNGTDPTPSVNYDAGQFFRVTTEGDLYVAYWDSVSGPVENPLVHLRWNGTYFEKQGDTIEWPPLDDETIPVANTASFIFITDDGYGVIIQGAGTYAVDVAGGNLHFYDRDPTSGVLTLRPDELVGLKGLTATEMVDLREPHGTSMVWTDVQEQGIDGV